LKDLGMIINRELRKMVIVDNWIPSFAKHMNNGIHIQSYFGQSNDSELERVADILKKISKCKNIPEELSKLLRLQEPYEKYLREFE
jgi:TFIIF-interacting CTD phosphatase-like protein